MHYFCYLNQQFQTHWNQPALSDYGQDNQTYTYNNIAQYIFRLHVLFQKLDLHAGDKMAIIGRNSSHWAMAFLAIAAYRGVVVSILPDFTNRDIQHLLAHSQSRLLFIDSRDWQRIHHDAFTFDGIVLSLAELQLLHGHPSTQETYVDWKSHCASRASKVERHAFHLPTENETELALINYTSGSTGNPKGVMLNAASLCSNIATGIDLLPVPKNARVLSILPLAHMFGMVCEFLYPLCTGCHIYFLAQTPTPTIVMKALRHIRPYMVVMVPLVIEKIYQRNLRLRISSGLVHWLWNKPLFSNYVRRKVKNGLNKAFGGKVKYFLLGGAAVNPMVEDCLLDIHFPLLVGYGMTECGPLIGGCHVHEFRARSCGRTVLNMEVRIDHPNEEGIGEILVKGTNVMMGYYHNEEATRQAFTPDGWLRTGDLGYMDSDGFIYLKGRKKTMFLNTSGQNIYPEEIENKLNTISGVEESLIVERQGKLVALVFPEEKIQRMEIQQIKEQLQSILNRLNTLVPHYSRVSNIEITTQPFEKTPKKSIKRFLYK